MKSWSLSSKRGRSTRSFISTNIYAYTFTLKVINLFIPNPVTLTYLRGMYLILPPIRETQALIPTNGMRLAQVAPPHRALYIFHRSEILITITVKIVNESRSFKILLDFALQSKFTLVWCCSKIRAICLYY